MISQFVGRNYRDWDAQIHALQYAFNTAQHEATGYTPAYLNHGRELRSPHPEDRRSQQTPALSETTHRQLEAAYDVVRTNLARAFDRQQKHYNLRRRAWRPTPGEWVWKRLHSLSNKKDAFNAKLTPKYAGPLEIKKILSPVVVDLRDKQRKWYRHVHVQDLKPAPHPRPDATDQSDVTDSDSE
ncbi:PREDICTED: uncharacterized protein LOC105449534 [Wasmannia auropunctata]|uniref:uncharacterized protein LOC105449534 n=1 Tax=Wasmannia auropunctata TaxID=64793 RepID=UPI0005EF3A48|nr:PREDICTED: uncharacterized protein LOC105449534 [Wasmannia auropunctata]